MCHTNLISFFDRITDFLNKANATDVIFLDFSKAFDVAPLGKLSVKMEVVKISRNPESLIRSQQQVEMKTDCINREVTTLGGGCPEHSPRNGLDTR